MPILQDPRQRFYDLWSDDPRPIRNHEQQNGISSSKPPRREERSISPPLQNPHQIPDRSTFSGVNFPGLGITDREGLIRYLKSADSPSWTQYPSVCACEVDGLLCLGTSHLLFSSMLT